MKATRLRIKLRAYDYKLLDNSVNEIVQTAKETGARVRKRKTRARTLS
jgi:small subunit ribosomal protein S10